MYDIHQHHQKLSRKVGPATPLLFFLTPKRVVLLSCAIHRALKTGVLLLGVSLSCNL